MHFYRRAQGINNALQGHSGDFTKAYINALKQDRQSFYLGDMLRSLGFILVTITTLFLYARTLIKPVIVYVALILFSIIDLFGVSKRYLKEENFIDPVDYDAVYADSKADTEIKKDTGFYRVLNLAFPGNGRYTSSSDPFEDAIASYRHNTIGGYNPAKLGLFQDLREKQLYKNIDAWTASPGAKDSFPVLNMLNMKYVIVPDQQNPQQTKAIQNKYAMGNCWLVKEVKLVKNADEEMHSLDSFDPATVAFVDERFKANILFSPVYDSTAYIKLLKNQNDEASYDFNASSNQFAVFSEIYYPDGWEAYMDGRPAPICRADYLLRGLSIPAGRHNIKFIFDPASVRTGETISRYANIFSVIFLLFCFFMAWKNRNNDQSTLQF